MIKEEQIYIKNNQLTLEGLLCKASEEKGVVICHPHPLMGGSMHNNVVEAIQEAYAAENYTTLRFNFRGVEGSTGQYDEGRGEQEDILAACKYLQDIGILKTAFAGYSFGAWVGAKFIERLDNIFANVTFVSPPINIYDLNFTKLDNKINQIICGSYDQFCDINILKGKIKNINANLRIISDADHFYFGQEKELVNILRVILRK
ncbi:MAG: hypothetical protein ABFD75_14705 [Smithella sp.]